METITCYKVRDKLFEDEQEAIRFEEAEKFREVIFNIVDDFFFIEISKNDIIDGLLDNKKRLIKAVEDLTK